jgi:hypothetical protein
MYPCLVNTNVFIFRAIQTNEIDNWPAALQLFLCQLMARIKRMGELLRSRASGVYSRDN